ncbi:MAG: aminotransferase class III-fold pyridoxal phosphate-dependent enzyme [Patiriisocius sp.]|uniref:aminotransferase class III-fold pyridoxal phosphate-dependent enzyme n=1 Tax=Patiriisocius sp. TaxID=2822396 RepID=UPI003EF09DA3
MKLAKEIEAAEALLASHFGLKGKLSKLPGDVDLNYKFESDTSERFLFKISTSNSIYFEDFQHKVLENLQEAKLDFETPRVLHFQNTEDGKFLRLQSWLSGRIWATINPKTAALRKNLGKYSGAISQALKDFEHDAAHRKDDWDLANSHWTFKHLDRFEGEEKNIISYFQNSFQKIQDGYEKLPKSVVHNDVNDYNILVSEDFLNPKVIGIIDFGDAIFTQTVNDLAIVISYASMELPDPLEAALDVVKGYNRSYRLSPEELQCLYVLVGMRLVVSVTKSSIRKEADPSNKYHVISEKPAWDLLKKWHAISSEFAHYSFRSVCDYNPHPKEEIFMEWAKSQDFKFADLFPTQQKEEVHLLNLKVSSTWMGNRHEFNNLDLFEFKINQLQKENPTKIIANGYLEPRPIYTSSDFDKEGNEGPESRTVHLGIDFWLPSGTPVNTMFDGTVVTANNEGGYKQYGGLIILKHSIDNLSFFSLYGHLSAESSQKLNIGDTIKKGDCIGFLGTPSENGNWSPHLHFQIMLSMLGNTTDFPGVTFPKQTEPWKSICPDPNFLFKNPNLKTQLDAPSDKILNFRKEHLGKGLSVSYKKPLHIVRGDGVYLMDAEGQKYLDTVNNVAHVGHEHPKVVEAGQQQMSILNTNTRYLHENITAYAQALLKKLPKELCVLHFVNSGSEANELALRMARTVTGQKEIMAIEVGYHGNTNAVIDVSSYKFDGKGGAGKPEHTHILPLPDPFRGRHAWETSGNKYSSYAQRHIEHLEIIDEKIAGFIGEPIISCGGQIVPPPGYFKDVYQYVHDAGGVCIADEVQTGFGRVGSYFWAFEMHDVIPDIVTMGKPAGNGHPLGIVACTRAVADAFANGMEYFNTFGGNPVSCSIGKVVLDIIELEELQKNALEVGTFLKDKLKNLQQSFPIIGDVRGEGFFLGFELVDSDKNPLASHATYLANRMRQKNILMSTDGPDHNVLKIKPPMVFSKQNAKELIMRLSQVFKEDFMNQY